MNDKICQNCKHWLNNGEFMMISQCKKGVIIGSCWYDNTCESFVEGINPLKVDD